MIPKLATELERDLIKLLNLSSVYITGYYDTVEELIYIIENHLQATDRQVYIIYKNRTRYYAKLYKEP